MGREGNKGVGSKVITEEIGEVKESKKDTDEETREEKISGTGEEWRRKEEGEKKKKRIKRRRGC